MEHVTIARWLSIVFHPFVMVGVMVGAAAAARQTAGEAVRSVGTVVLFTIVPLAVLMWRQVRRGQWENVDASNRGERPILYVVGGAGVVALLAYVGRDSSAVVHGARGDCDARHDGPVRRCHPVDQSLVAHGICGARGNRVGPCAIADWLPAAACAAGTRVVSARPAASHAARGGLGAIIGAGAAAALHFL